VLFVAGFDVVVVVVVVLVVVAVTFPLLTFFSLPPLALLHHFLLVVVMRDDVRGVVVGVGGQWTTRVRGRGGEGCVWVRCVKGRL